MNSMNSGNLAEAKEAGLESVDKVERFINEAKQVNFEAKQNSDKKNPASGDLKQKQIKLLKAIEQDPNVAENYSELAEIYLDAKDYFSASKYFKKAISLNDQDASSYANLGRTQYHLGEKDEAESNIKKALDLDPKNSSYAKDLSKIKFVKAKELRKQSLLVDGEKQKRLLDRAENEIRSCLKLCVKLRFFDELLGICYKKGSFIDIMDAVKQESELNAQRAHSILVSAEEALKNKIKNPVSAIVQAYDLLVLSYVFEKQDKIDEAIKFLKQAKTLIPEEPTFFYAESVVLQNSHRKAESIAALEQAKLLVSYYGNK
ncbi:MAG: tetratricopeptide repeat protein [Deltaproteobacteria bacterium]|nr:tetratricopeptide repeat protein [Deltaproteobacteria bacterium]